MLAGFIISYPPTGIKIEGGLMVTEFKNILEVAKNFEDPKDCLNYIATMRWDGHVICPFKTCGHDKIYVLKGRYQQFKCAKCRRHFSAIKGSIFENSPIPLQKWMMAVYLIIRKKSVSSLQLAADITVTQKTAWFMNQRIRYAMEIGSFEMAKDGAYQADETYVGGKNKNRHANKRIPKAQGRSLKDKTPVIGIIGSDGKLHMEVAKDTKAKSIEPFIAKYASPGSIIITDEWTAYKQLNKKYDHVVLLHKNEEYVRGAFHTNTIEGAWSLFKRNLDGIHHWVSKKHLHRYIAEFKHRYNTRDLTGPAKFESVLKNADRRLTYMQLTGKDETQEKTAAL